MSLKAKLGGPSLQGRISLLSCLRESLGTTPIYLVGGFVRQALLGKEAADFDIALAGDVPSLAKRLADAWGGSFFLLDEGHSMARVILKQGRHLDISPLPGSIEQDLGGRDFTIDAIALPLEQALTGEGKVVDPFGGQKDLRAKLVRAVSPGVFDKDPLRLLRAVRLAAELDFQVEENTKALLLRDAPLLSRAAAERVRDELCRILETPRAAAALRFMDEMGLFKVLFPELEEARGVEQPKEHYWDVFHHSLETVAALERLFGEAKGEESLLEGLPPPSEHREHFAEEVSGGHSRKGLVKLAGLLHDIAKPKTKTLEAGGRIRFLGHARQGAEIAEAIMTRLRFSRREIDVVARAIVHHLRPQQMAQGELPTPRAIYRFFRDAGDEAVDILYLSLADHWAARGPHLIPEEWREHGKVTVYILETRKAQPTPPPHLIDGHDIMAAFSLPPGPLIGQLLEKVAEAQAAGEIGTREEALALVKTHLESSHYGYLEGAMK